MDKKVTSRTALSMLMKNISKREMRDLEDNSVRNPGAEDTACAVMITPAVWEAIRAALSKTSGE